MSFRAEKALHQGALVVKKSNLFSKRKLRFVQLRTSCLALWEDESMNSCTERISLIGARLTVDNDASEPSFEITDASSNTFVFFAEESAEAAYSPMTLGTACHDDLPSSDRGVPAAAM